jgi:PAS domain S-box-containing protein
MDAIGKGLTVSPFETVFRTMDGRGLDVSVSISAIRNPAGEIPGIAAIVRDIARRPSTMSLFLSIRWKSAP